MIYFVGDIRRIIDNDGSISPLSIDKAIEDINREAIICEDTETFGLDFTKPNQVRLIQLGTKENQYVFDATTCDIDKLGDILSSKKIEKIVANVYFERNMLRSIGLVINNTFDLLISAKVLRQGRKDRFVYTDYGRAFITSLAGLYKEYLDISIPKSEQSSFLYGNNYSLSQIKYAARDVELFDIYEKLIEKLLTFNLIHKNYSLTDRIKDLANRHELSVTVLENKVSLYFADMMYNGIFIDLPEMLKLYDKNIERRYDIELSLNKQAIAEFEELKGYREIPFNVKKVIQKSLFEEDVRVLNKGKDSKRLNWNSQKQIKPIIFKTVGKTIKDKYGKETIGIKELDKPAYKQYSLVSKFIKYKKISKLISSYGIKYKEHINLRTNRIHCSVNQVLETGRVALKKPNLAQIPGGLEWRMLFRSQEDTDIVGADYSGQESQVMADKSEDKAFVEFFKNGDGDSHSMVASRVYSIKEHRDIIVKKYSLAVEVQNDEETAKQMLSNLYPIDISKASLKEINKKLYAFYEDTNEVEDDRISCSLRQKGKVLNFFISFGGSAYNLKDSQGISLEDANDLLNGFWKGFPELKIYFDEEKKKVIKHGFIIVNNITNRRRWLPDWKEYRQGMNELDRRKKEFTKQFSREGVSMFYKRIKEKGSDLYQLNRRTSSLKGDMERAAMNTGIQGTAADMTKTAECLLMEKLEDKGIDLVSTIKPVNHIHDEIMLETDKNKSKMAASLLRLSMEEASVIYTEVLTIEAKPYINDYWIH